MKLSAIPNYKDRYTSRSVDAIYHHMSPALHNFPNEFLTRPALACRTRSLICNMACLAEGRWIRVPGELCRWWAGWFTGGLQFWIRVKVLNSLIYTWIFTLPAGHEISNFRYSKVRVLIYVSSPGPIAIATDCIRTYSITAMSASINDWSGLWSRLPNSPMPI